MAEYDEARRLLFAAYRDLRALQGMTDALVFADEIFGFHAQQAAEKALKAWLALLGVEYPKTHDITLLLSMLTAHGQSVDSLYDLIEFNPYAVQLRYEAFDEVGEPLQRDAVIARVGELVRKVQALIGRAG
ncbi:MAG: HEPN domain-containing protein [Bacillota bacterium]